LEKVLKRAKKISWNFRLWYQETQNFTLIFKTVEKTASKFTSKTFQQKVKVIWPFYSWS
jgi:hypothetical protein